MAKDRLHLKKLGFVSGALALFSAECFATTKGLSQIVTPDLQPAGDLSISYQHQSSAIGNPDELQAELGITSWSEVAVFQGFSPGEEIFSGEFSAFQKPPWLLSAGFLNFSTVESAPSPQPFLESGFYTEHNKGILGLIYANSKTELLLGWADDIDFHWRVQLDFQSGDENYFTAGFTYNLNERFQFNPALYFPNSGDRGAVKGYVVFTYTFPVWKRGSHSL